MLVNSLKGNFFFLKRKKKKSPSLATFGSVPKSCALEQWKCDDTEEEGMTIITNFQREKLSCRNKKMVQ